MNYTIFIPALDAEIDVVLETEVADMGTAGLIVEVVGVYGKNKPDNLLRSESPFLKAFADHVMLRASQDEFVREVAIEEWKDTEPI